MESKTSSGQILIECTIGLFTLAILLSFLIGFSKPKYRKKTRSQEIGVEKQKLNFQEFRNEK